MVATDVLPFRELETLEHQSSALLALVEQQAFSDVIDGFRKELIDGYAKASALVQAVAAQCRELRDAMIEKMEKEGVGAVKAISELVELRCSSMKWTGEVRERFVRPLWEKLLPRHLRRSVSDALTELEEANVDFLRCLLVYHPDVVETLPPNVQERVLTIKVCPWAYLRAMANLFWSALRYPFRETVIDFGTGRVLSRL